MSTWLYPSSRRIYSFTILFIISFLFWSSDIFLIGCIMIGCFIKQEKPNTTSTTTTTMTWDILNTAEEKEEKNEVDSEHITLKHIHKRIADNTRELQLLSQYWPDIKTDLMQFNDINSNINYIKDEKEKEKEEKEKEIIALKSELLQAHQTIEQLKSQLDTSKIELRQSLENMRQEHLKEKGLFNQEKTGLVEKINQLEENLTKHQQLCNEQMENNAKLKDTIHELQTQHEVLMEHLDEEEQKSKKMDLFVRENNKELQRVTDHAMECEYQIEDLKLQLQHNQERLNTLENMEEEMMALEQDLDGKKNEIIELKAMETLLKQEMEQIAQNQQQELARQQEQTKQQQNESGKVKEELNTLLQQMDLEKASLQKLLENKAKLTLEVSELSEQLYQMGQQKQQHVQELQQSNQDHYHGLVEHISDYSENKSHHKQQQPHRLSRRLANGRQERSSSIPRLNLSRSTSLKTNNNRYQYEDIERELYDKTQQCNEAHQVISRLETIVGELQRQLDDSHSHLEDRDERLRNYFAS
ncbi:hypothetical protein BJ944DRAFT_263625 [Cunninghamella echinulata]|nr:hypothetical protein BJ944DRAFT_263625 [Cunninghamella echinulata]